MARKDILEKEKEIRQWVSEHQSKAFICRQLKCKAETLERYLALMGIEYKGNIGGKGIKNSGKYIDAITYINSGSVVKSHMLKLKLIKDGLKEHRCERCGNTEWLGKPIPIELHHKNGDHYDNSLDNLEILCPNCHAQEGNNSGAALKHKE